MNALRRLLNDGRICVRHTAQSVKFSQLVETEGPGLSAPSLDLAHIYVQLNVARQYWLDQRSSLLSDIVR